MLTPRQNLEEADRLLQEVQDDLNGSEIRTIDIEAFMDLAEKRIQLAQALHMVQLAENLDSALEETRPRRLGAPRLGSEAWNSPEDAAHDREPGDQR